jgi:sulfur carrier protein
MTQVEVNGVARVLAVRTTVSDVVATMVRSETGCAVAVNGEVVPRGSWSARVLADGDRVEILTAVQGG